MGATTRGTFAVYEYAQEIELDAPREKVFDVLTTEVGEWFPARFIEGSTVACEPWVGGRLYEDLGDGQGYLWSVCTALVRPSSVSYQGPWGFAGNVTILVRYQLEERGDRTLLNVKHTIVGDLADDAVAGYEAHIKPLKQLLTDYFATLS